MWLLELFRWLRWKGNTNYCLHALRERQRWKLQSNEQEHGILISGARINKPRSSRCFACLDSIPSRSSQRLHVTVEICQANQDLVWPRSSQYPSLFGMCIRRTQFSISDHTLDGKWDSETVPTEEPICEQIGSGELPSLKYACYLYDLRCLISQTKTLDVINGLSYLHSRDIIHGDMKAVRHCFLPGFSRLMCSSVQRRISLYPKQAQPCLRTLGFLVILSQAITLI